MYESAEYIKWWEYILAEIDWEPDKNSEVLEL